MGANFLVKSKSGSLIRKWIFHFFPKIQKRIIDPNDPQRRWILWIISKNRILKIHDPKRFFATDPKRVNTATPG